MEKPELVASFAKNCLEDVRVSLTTYKGYDLVDIRVWFRGSPADPPESARPSQKGLSLSRDLLPDLRRALAAAARMIGDDHGQDADEDGAAAAEGSECGVRGDRPSCGD